MPDYDVETSQGTVTITLDREVDPAILKKSQQVREAVARVLKTRTASTTTTPTTTEGVPGQGVRIPRSADAPLEAAGAMLGGAAALPATAGLGPVAPVIGAGLGGAMANRAVDFMRGSPRAAAAAAREELGREGPSPAETVAEETASAVGRGAVGEAGGRVAVPILGGAARAVGLSRPLEAGAAAAKQAAGRLGIPLTAADITGSRTLAGIERTPSYFTFGSGIMQRFREGQLGAAGRATGEVIQSIAQTEADEITAGRMAQGGLRAAARGFRGDAEQLFRTFDESIGPEPVVPTTQFRQAVGGALERGRQTPYGPQAAARRFQGGETVVEPTGEVSAASAVRTAAPERVPPSADTTRAGRRALEMPGARTGERLPVPGGGAPLEGEYAGQQATDLDTLIHEATAQEYIPWRLARDIEAQLGELAFGRGGGPVGTIRQGQAGALYAAIRGDMDTFLSTPGREGTRAELEELKQWYATGKALFNESVVQGMGKRRGAMKPEKIIATAFRAGQVTDTLDFKLAVSDEAYEQAVGAWMQGLQAKATQLVGGREVFSPGTFVRELGRYEKNGHLDVILPPEGARAMRELTTVLSRLGSAERLAGNPAGTGQSIMGIQQLMPLLRLGPDAIAGGLGSAAAGLPGAVGALALPMGLAKAVTSPRGIDLLELLSTRAFSGRYARPAVRGAAQLGAQAIPALPR